MSARFRLAQGSRRPAAAIVAAAALLSTLVAAPPPTLSDVISSLDYAVAALGLWPTAESAAAGDHDWCVNAECMRTVFRVSASEVTLGGTPDVVIGDFSVLRFLLSVAVAGVVTNVAMRIADRIACMLFAHFDASKCSLPSVLPWPDPPGNSTPFDVPVPEASEEQLAKFLAFRGVALPASDAARREAAAREAVSYMAELFDRKHNDWCYRHYALKEKGLSFPYRAPFMNAWDFYGETSAHLRPVGNGQVIFALHHTVEGLLLPLLYFSSGDASFFYFALYADMGVEAYMTSSPCSGGISPHISPYLPLQAYDILALLWRRATGVDHTLTRHHPSVDAVLVPHLLRYPPCVGEERHHPAVRACRCRTTCLPSASSSSALSRPVPHHLSRTRLLTASTGCAE